MAYNLAIFFVLHVKTRYRLPFLPVFDLLAAIGLAALCGHGRFGGPVRCAVAGLAAALLLFAGVRVRILGTMPVAIVGMHRAGTSMIARVLRICGVDLGDEVHFAPPAPDNTEGYWEDLRFVDWNERILDTFGGAWDVVPQLPAGWPTDERLGGVREGEPR